MSSTRWPGRDDASTASLALLPFAAAVAVLSVVAPFGADQLRAADPLVQAIVAGPGLWSVPALAAVVAVFHVLRTAPSRATIGPGLRRALLGAVAAAVLLVALAVALGGALPPFVPPEESAKPGLLLGLAAGVVEEALFRLVLLPPLFAAAARRLRPAAAIAVAVVATGACFAASHELGPGAGTFRPDLFATRLVFPGAFLSLLCFRPGPSFVVVAHATAHVLMPALLR